MNGFKGLIGAALLAALTGCTDKQAALQAESLTFVTQWFAEAADGNRTDELCHAFGLLKHQEASCADMLDSAAKIDPHSRTVLEVRSLDCFAEVCGEFVEIRFSSQQQIDEQTDEQTDKQSVAETALLKRDDGRFRLYWYRSDLLLADISARYGQDQDSDPLQPSDLQAAYNQLTAAFPSLYRYPPCLDKRPSSSNLRGQLMTTEEINVEEIERHAQDCGSSFCFALVGQKIASLCP